MADLGSRLRKNRFVRKGAGLLRQVPRAVHRWRASEDDYRRLRPILVNSFPKSGTHLLLQVVQALPGRTYYGSFLASQPTISFRERSTSDHLRHIARLAPGEVMPAHLFHAPVHAEALRHRAAVHLLMVRDLRDVAVSEAWYLTHMNRWHGMHGYFNRHLRTADERIMASIRGVPRSVWPYEYPDIGARFARYAGWLDEPDVLVVRFEDLAGPGRADTVRRIVRACLVGSREAGEEDRWTRVAADAIDPSRSHTFREGRVGGWRTAMSPEVRSAAEPIVGPWLERLGYERHDGPSLVGVPGT